MKRSEATNIKENNKTFELITSSLRKSVKNTKNWYKNNLLFYQQYSINSLFSITFYIKKLSISIPSSIQHTVNYIKMRSGMSVTLFASDHSIHFFCCYNSCFTMLPSGTPPGYGAGAHRRTVVCVTV